MAFGAAIPFSRGANIRSTRVATSRRSQSIWSTRDFGTGASWGRALPILALPIGGSWHRNAGFETPDIVVAGHRSQPKGRLSRFEWPLLFSRAPLGTSFEG